MKRNAQFKSEYRNKSYIKSLVEVECCSKKATHTGMAAHTMRGSTSKVFLRWCQEQSHLLHRVSLDVQSYCKDFNRNLYR